MTSISLIAPYAPQPAVAGAETSTSPAVAVQPFNKATFNTSDGTASDQSGTGAGNGTGTGGALTAMLLDRARATSVSDATPKSVVEAQSKSDATAEYLAHQKAEQAQATAQANAKADAAAQQATEDRRAEEKAAAEAARFEMPNPLPTAPILQDDPI